MSKPPEKLRVRLTPRDDVIHLVIRIALLAALVYWAYVLVWPFAPIVLWSTVLAVALYPAYDWLARKLGGRRTLSAILITAFSLTLFAGPRPGSVSDWWKA